MGKRWSYERTTWSHMNTRGTEQRHSPALVPSFTLDMFVSALQMSIMFSWLSLLDHIQVSCKWQTYVPRLSNSSCWAMIWYTVPVVTVSSHHSWGWLAEGTIRCEWRRVLCSWGRVEGLRSPYCTIVRINWWVSTGRSRHCIISTMRVVWRTREPLGWVWRTHGARRGWGQCGSGPDVGARGRGTHWWPQTVRIHGVWKIQIEYYSTYPFLGNCNLQLRASLLTK